MPLPFPVNLVPHDPAWADRFAEERRAWADALGECLVDFHHIGSTAIPGIYAKPVIDIIPVFRSLPEFASFRPAVEALGYVWHGEYGLPGRRYCTKSDAAGCRLVQAHAYAQGSPEIVRHLAFRDHLRAHPAIAAAYDRVKADCRKAHPTDSHAYTDCKSDWFKRVEAEALAQRRG